MRKFHSYGPVDSNYHFCTERKELIKNCVEQLIGNKDNGGHYFTIWAPRQTGKTWLMREVMNEIKNKYSSMFAVGFMSMQGLIIKEDDPDEIFFAYTAKMFKLSFSIEIKPPLNWNEWIDLFSVEKGNFNQPAIVLIDEFDSLPPKIIDNIVTLFRDIYLNRKNFTLHGLALIGVRAVLGVDSDRGSPFNVQRSLHVPNFTKEEVNDLFQQYQNESRQKVSEEVIESLYEATRGQPGLVCWFGELLTEKYNMGKDKEIDIKAWESVYMRALYIEWNNTVLNLVKKAKGVYKDYVIKLYTNPDISFKIDSEWCSYLYLNGIIDAKIETKDDNKQKTVCIFSCPFIQHRIYNALTDDLTDEEMPVLALEPLDDLSDVFEKEEIDVCAMLQRYKKYLKRLRGKGLNPWKDQPRRTDLRLTEAVGHFHLYSWLKAALQDCCVVSPEFPTGNGKVDLHIKCGLKHSIIEVKSFKTLPKLNEGKITAAKYAKNLNVNSVTMAVFISTTDEETITKLSTVELINDVTIKVVAIEWS